MTFGIVKRWALFGLLALTTGCATKTTIRALEPAEVDRSASLKQIGVLQFDEKKYYGFGRYGINLATKLEARLTNYRLDDKPYFVIVNRSDLDRVLDEQKLQHSGLFSQNKLAELGKLTGAQALISGSVSSASSNDSYYRDTRTREKCDQYGRNCKTSEYTVSCTMRQVGLGVQIRMVDVERGDLVTAQSFNETEKWSACKDEKKALPSREQALETLSERVVAKFVDKITPKYVSFQVALLDDVDVVLPERQEKEFEAALEFIEIDRLDRAEQLLSELHYAVQQQSYAIAYNLGVVKEASADYESARQLYQVADRLTLEPVDEINTALARIDRLIVNNRQARNQLNRD